MRATSVSRVAARVAFLAAASTKLKRRAEHFPSKSSETRKSCETIGPLAAALWEVDRGYIEDKRHTKICRRSRGAFRPSLSMHFATRCRPQ
jgi:hypothetical protein